MTAETIDNKTNGTILKQGLWPRDLYVFYEIFCGLSKNSEERATPEDLEYFLSEGWDALKENKNINHKGFKISKSGDYLSFEIPIPIFSEFSKKAIEYLKLSRAHDTTDPLLLLYVGK